jgi:hypothetical protein
VHASIINILSVLSHRATFFFLEYFKADPSQVLVVQVNTPVILPLWEAEVRRIGGRLGQIVWGIPTPIKITRASEDWRCGLNSGVPTLLCKCEALGSNPVHIPQKKQILGIILFHHKFVCVWHWELNPGRALYHCATTPAHLCVLSLFDTNTLICSLG